MKYLLYTFALLLISTIQAQSSVTINELKEHIDYLTSDQNKGRLPGSKSNKKTVKYLLKHFRKAGLMPIGKSYLQPFEAELRSDNTQDKVKVKTWNVIAYLEGNDPMLKHEYIVLGAHYDHLGLGGPSSKSKARGVVYHGADDNASGTAALLEIAEQLVANQNNQLKRSIIFVAFGAEEQGLLGSKYFVNHPPVALDNIKLMINMDMVGRLNHEKQVFMGGAGTFPDGVALMTKTGKNLGLNPIVHAGSVGGSDHVSFYKKNISVLGMHTGGHAQYHTPEDIANLINYEGEKMVCEYIYQTIIQLATNYPLTFIPQD